MPIWKFWDFIFSIISMILIDTNALIVLIHMDIRLIKSHKTTSIYEEEDYYNLVVQTLKN